MRVNLEPNELSDAYTEAIAAAKQWFLPFDEYERLAANKLRSNLPKNMPKVNDGSLAALLLEAPMRVLAQMLTGSVIVKDRDEAWLSELANILWTKTVIPNAKTQAPFFAKLQIALYRAMQYGACPAYSFFTVRGEYRGADFVLPYIRDIALEPGKVSDADSDYIFMHTWYTKLQLKNIVAAAQEENRLAKEQGRPSENQWDIAELKAIVDSDADGKDSQFQSRTERDKANRSGPAPYKFVTCFQRGAGAPFYTFSPGRNGNKPVRKGVNRDPRGDLPVHFLYAFEDLTNPYGKGQIEVSGGTQNVLDYMTQLHVLGTQIGLQPPIKIQGPRDQVQLSSIVYAPNAYWLTGTAEVEPVQTANAIYNQFPTVYGLYKSQLMNMQGNTDVSISADSGNPGYSKTPAGIKQLQERTNAHDNFLRRQVNYFFNCLASSMINIHMSQMQGTELVKVVDEEATRLMRSGLIDEDPETKAPSTNEIQVLWENMRGTFEFEVDPESSIAKDDELQKEKLMELITLAAEKPQLMSALAMSGKQLDVGEAMSRLIMKLGVDDWEKILVPIEAAEGAVPGAPGPGGGGVETEIARVVEQYGADPSQAQAVLEAEQQGFTPEEIASYIQGTPV